MRRILEHLGRIGLTVAAAAGAVSSVLGAPSRRADKRQPTPERPRRRSGARRRVVVAATAGACALAVAVIGAVAYWSTTGSGTASANSGSLSAATISASTTTSSVTVTWDTQAAMTPASQSSAITYTVERKLGASSYAPIVSGPCSGSLPYNTASCTDTLTVSGSYTYRVVAHYSTAWTALSNEVTLSVITDADAPATTLAFPLDTGVYNALSFTGGCTPTGVCGTATDASGVDTVRVSVRRLSDGAYWDGAAYTGFSEFFIDAVLASPGTTNTAWSFALPLPGDGQYTVHVQAKDTVGNDSAPTNTSSATFTVDSGAPTQVVTMASPVNAFLNAGTVYYRGSVSGSFTLVDAVSDAGTGPASATFPGIATTGWTHAAETVTTGTGTDPRSYTSSAYSWAPGPANPSAQTITGADGAGNTVTTALTFVNDTAAPTGGALTVNGVAASAGGSTSGNFSGSFPIDVRTDYTDTESGVATSTLVRERATLSANTCDTTWTNATTITGSPTQSGLATAFCYRYTLTGTDNVGNSASIFTIVKLDTSAPSFGSPALTLSDTGAFAHYPGSGTTVYYNGNTGTSSSITVNAPNVADGETGIQKVNFPALGSAFAGGGDDTSSPYSTTYTWTSSADSGTKAVTATNGITNTSTSSFSLVRDVTAPAGGAVTVNSVVATAGGSTSTDTDGSFSITGRTDYTETQNATQSGLASGGSTLVRESATLTANACGSFGSPTTVSGTTSQSGLTTGCYRYTLSGTDNVGNTTSISTIVKVDTSNPTFGSPALTLSVTGSFAHYSGSGTTVFYNGNNGASSSITVDAPNVVDADSGIASVTFPSPAGFSGGGADASSPFGATYTWSSSTANGSQTVTVTNGVTRTATTTFTLSRDVTNPSGGTLNVNSTAASGAGTVSNNTTGSYTISRTDYNSDSGGSGVDSSTLVREEAPLLANGSGCGTFGSPTTIVGNPTQNAGAGIATGFCYRYTLTGVDNVSNTVSIVTTVRVDTTGPSFGTPALTIADTGAFAHYPGTGTTVYYNGTTGTGSNITISADNVSDPQSGIQNVIFPNLTGFTGGGTDTNSPFSTVYTWSSASDSGTKNVTVTNGIGSTATSPFTLVRDIVAPSGASLVVNGQAADSAGTSSGNTTGSFTIGTRNDYVETQSGTASGVLSSLLVRDEATLDANFTCGTFGSATAIVGTPAQSGLSNAMCYRYTLTGTDNVSNTASVNTTVKVDTVAPTATNVQLTGNGGSATTNDTVVVTYSELMDVSSFCAAWANDGNDKSIDGNSEATATITNAGTNDVLTVSTVGAVGCTGGFKLGSISLGGDYVAATRTFTGTGGSSTDLIWDVSSRTLTIELGTASGSVNSGIAAGTPSYFADTTLKDRAGSTIGAGPYTGSPASRF